LRQSCRWSYTDLFKKQGVSVDMHCSHNIESYNRILWYKQDGHRRLIFLGYMVGTSVNPEVWSPESSAQRKGSEKQWSLTVQRLQVSDQAVYLCAVKGDKVQKCV
uniref:Immunoglobulin V-set domain-containing protein n=1 Tax=Esox lucius TaxID=8010 RepID=A0AAY5K583_ESOLU